MSTINVIKQLAEADTPLLFFQCVLPSGACSVLEHLHPSFWWQHLFGSCAQA